MIFLRVLFMCAAFSCFVLNALNISFPKGNALGMGLAFWILAELVKQP
jgi:hypothetical protein